MTRQADVVIIGSGVIGNATAYYLTKAGKRVIVLDWDDVGNGASTRNGGINKMNGRGLGELSLGMYGVNELWPELDAALGLDTEYAQVGGYHVAVGQEQEEYIQRFLPYGRAYGMHLEEMDGKALRSRVPAFSDRITYGVYCAEEGRANPMRVTLGLYAKAREQGAQYYCGQKVTALETHQGRIHAAITESGDRFVAPQILVAAGYNSRSILDTVGIDVPMYTYFEEIFVTEKLPLLLRELFISAKVTYYGHQAANGTIIFGGASGIDHFPHREWYENRYQLLRRMPAEARGLMDIFPCLAKAKIVRGWSGWMDITPDDSMMIGPIAEIPGLYLACGFSGHGFGMSIPTGKVMSEWILG